MTRSFRTVLFLGGLMAAMVGCRREAVEPPLPAPGHSPVVFDPAALPYPLLSDYRLFAGQLAELSPATGVLPYGLINTLFSDHAGKTRHVWMPAGSYATFTDQDHVLNFPDGTILVKTFHYDNVVPDGGRRILETRLLYRWAGEWHFANYVWNASQDEAVLDMAGSVTPVDWVDGEGITRHVDYRIPAASECVTCHRSNNVPTPIGPKPRNLHTTYPYPDGAQDQLVRWAQAGFLEPGYPTVTALPSWTDATQDLTARARAYLDINCAHCHSTGSYCDYRPMRFAWEDTGDPTNLGVCVTPHDPFAPGVTHIVAASRPERSMVRYRMASTAPEERMPVLGRTVIHEEGLHLIESWINSLDPPCP